MKIQFESNLDYQGQAIEAVAGLFAGQQINRSEFTVTAGVRGNMSTLGMAETDLGVGNRLSLLPDEVHSNLNATQLANGLAPSPGPLAGDYTIEMETGTGKTYVYLRTAFELHRRYGFTKFVIVVPSIAIKEGVMKSLDMTREHFGTLYPEAKGYDFYAYDSAKLNQVRDFATSSSLRFMVATIQALYSVQEAAEEAEGSSSRRKAERVIHRPNEQTGGEKPIDLIRATNPVLIVDEPQSVYGDAGKVSGKGKKGGEGQGRRALALLNPLCTLRYSATPLDKTQMVFRLDAVDAYERKLVKGIEVASMQVVSGHNKPYVRVAEIKKGGARTVPTARLEIDVADKAGKVTRKEIQVQDGDSLFERSGNRDLYREKFDAVLAILDGVLDVQRPDGGFYLWAKTPIDDETFTRELFAREHVTVVPGSYLSRAVAGHNPGAGRVRLDGLPRDDREAQAGGCDGARGVDRAVDGGVGSGVRGGGGEPLEVRDEVRGRRALIATVDPGGELSRCHVSKVLKETMLSRRKILNRRRNNIHLDETIASTSCG